VGRAKHDAHVPAPRVVDDLVLAHVGQVREGRSEAKGVDGHGSAARSRRPERVRWLHRPGKICGGAMHRPAVTDEAVVATSTATCARFVDCSPGFYSIRR
jgi:hypothetical protein